MIECSICLRNFASKSALFHHLKDLDSTCLSLEEHASLIQKDLERDDRKFRNTRNLEKIALLFGYINADKSVDDGDKNKPWVVYDGDRAARIIVQVVHHLAKYGRRATTTKLTLKPDSADCGTVHRRSFGCAKRNQQFAQDPIIGTVAEVLSMKAPPLAPSTGNETEYSVVKKWLDDINIILEQGLSMEPFHSDKTIFYGKIKVFGRLSVHRNFDAEAAVSHRRVEYLLPVDFLYASSFPDDQNYPTIGGIHLPPSIYKSSTSDDPKEELHNFFRLFPCYSPTNTLKSIEVPLASLETPISSLEEKDTAVDFIYRYLSQLKKIMQSLTTSLPSSIVTSEYKQDRKGDTVEFIESHDEDKMMLVNDMKAESEDSDDSLDEFSGCKKRKDGDSSDLIEVKNAKILSNKKTKIEVQRVHKYYHNFTADGMAHESAVFRRMDRFYHRSTVTTHDHSVPEFHRHRPFLVLSLKGDSFLAGQIPGMIGLFIAIIRGFVPKEIIECMFDHEFPDLVTAPFIPTQGMIASEAMYSTWEGKLGLVLSPRNCNRYDKGWNSNEILENVRCFQEEIYEKTIQSWYSKGTHSLNGRLNCEFDWVRDYLNPWSLKALEKLKKYQEWKQTQKERHQQSNPDSLTSEIFSKPISSIDTRVPILYEKVLYYLRQVNSSGSWPATTAKRKLVMVSSDSVGTNASSNNKISSDEVMQTSSYTYAVGQGGASGSFTVGAMPGDRCEQPRSNAAFPELMKSAFELEMALCPDREPSSTIAINRNAQFRPHVDVGAGAGQSMSLIVALGDFVGGELMVEGESHNIRYQPLEFDGWKQRHWTMPFSGERYSLVWFTPKGCDGIHGIDLCQ